MESGRTITLPGAEVLGGPRASRIHGDLARLCAGLEDERADFAEAIIHLAADMVDREFDESRTRSDIDPDEAAILARFGIIVQRESSAAPVPISPAVEAGLIHQARLLASAVPIAEAARRLGVDASRLHQRISDGTLLAIRHPSGPDWLIPAFQLLPDGELPHLALVLGAARRRLSPVTVEGAFQLPDEETGGMNARDWLAGGGEPVPVARLVASL